MNWTTPQDLRAQVERLWIAGRILTDGCGEDGLFPLALRLVGPDSQEWSIRFDQARRWARSLDEIPHAAVMKERRRHPTLGENEFPIKVVVETRGHALAWIDKCDEAERFVVLLSHTRDRCPEIEPWVARFPLKALEVEAVWTRLLDVVEWFRANSRSGIFLRELDLPGIDTKFLEPHRAMLSVWFDLVLEAKGEAREIPGSASFESRYGFLEKPHRVRFRILDPLCVPDAFGGATDLELDAEAFARWDPLQIRSVFVLENEITFLAFPPHPRSIAIFGSGYGFEGVGKAQWMGSRDLFYWGDLDTHGFAILDGFRRHFPNARSFLMDRGTLVMHRDRWMRESKPSRRVLERLEPHEREVYEDLVANTLGENVRLEQERIGMGCLRRALGSK